MISSITRKCLAFGSLECVVSGAKQRPVTQLESGLPIVCGLGTEALYEVLVGVGRVELDECDSLIGTGEMLREFLRDVGLARARRPLKDDLEFVFEEGLDVFEEADGLTKDRWRGFRRDNGSGLR